ncbi:hypothetical protein MVEG_09527 [Podila verticillata NRRL 6337]|nr:hypothetical protein MVEG_09527 [Podila verticillata NRRL 6337]
MSIHYSQGLEPIKRNAPDPEQFETIQEETATSSTHFQDIVIALPELRSKIARYLKVREFKLLLRVCQVWHDLWASELYEVTHLRYWTRVPPNMDKYGHHVRTLRLNGCASRMTHPLVRKAPRLLRLEIWRVPLSSSELEELLSSAPSSVNYLWIELNSRRISSQLPLYSSSIIHSFAHFQNLQTLKWKAGGMTVHVDDILRVLQACPHLTSLEFDSVRIVFLDPSSNDQQGTSTVNKYLWASPGPLTPIPALDSALHVGHRLKSLRLTCSPISDSGLLRLLGIDLTGQVSSQAYSQAQSIQELHHALEQFHITDDSFGLSDRSGARILEECSQLQVFVPGNDNEKQMFTARLLQHHCVWACTWSLQTLQIHRKETGALSLQEQRQIWERIQSLVNLRKLTITKAPFSISVVPDMSFARRLEEAYFELVPREVEPSQSETDEFLELGRQWAQRQPHEWQFQPPRYIMSNVYYMILNPPNRW